MLNQLRDEIHQNAVEHGWWKEERSFGEIIALCHSELSEALEEYRQCVDTTYEYYECKQAACSEHEDGICQVDGCGKGKPCGVPSELADCIIRILDYCGKMNIDIERVIRIKHEYNKTRPYRHGGKRI